MNIIIEGIDKAGKSTIAADIREALYPVNPITFKLTQKPQQDNFFSQEAVITLYKEMFGQTRHPQNAEHLFIFDRSYPSEMVYSIKRGYDALSNKDLLELDAKLGEEHNTLLIYCEADAKTISKRFKSEKEEYLTDEDIEQILERYNIFLMKTKLPFIKINSLTDRGANLAAVRKFLNR